MNVKIILTEEEKSMESENYQQMPVQQNNQQQFTRPQGSPGSGLAIASLVCGIVSLTVSCCIPYLPFVLSLLAVVFGGISLGKHRGGKGMAIAGLICGIVGLIPAIIVLVGGASLLSSLSQL